MLRCTLKGMESQHRKHRICGARSSKNNHQLHQLSGNSTGQPAVCSPLALCCRHTRQDEAINCFLPKGGRCSSWVQGHVFMEVILCRLLLSCTAYPASSQVVLGLFSTQQPQLCAGRVTGAQGEEHWLLSI